jgi:hypothetical protein
MKSAKPTNGKKINLKLKDLEVTTNKDPRGGTCRKAGGDKVNRPLRDGLSYNHNEMFLADLS